MSAARLILIIGVAATVTAVAAGSSAGRALPNDGLSLVRADQLGPSHGGASRAALGWIPLHAADFAQAKAAANARGGLAGNHGKPGGGGGGGPTVLGYSNVSPSFNAAYQKGVTPPDTTGAIGPDRYIETINTEYAIYTRSGSPIRSGSLSSLTGISGGLFGHSLSDPQVMWDAETQRFYYAAVYFDALLSDNGLAVGWSKTATP